MTLNNFKCNHVMPLHFKGLMLPAPVGGGGVISNLTGGNHSICIKFGRPVQNHMPMAVKRSKSRPEVEFQDGGRLFSEIGIVISRPWIEIPGRNLIHK